MSKDEGGRTLLSKLVRFVKNPTVDWSELDKHPQAPTENHQAIRAALQRRHRNDQIRQAEFDQLRALMRQQRVALPASDDTRPSMVTASGQEADRSGTIEKIARIEEQMSENWLRRQGERAPEEGTQLHIGSGTTIPASLDGGVTQPGHLQASKDGRELLSIDVVAEEPTNLPDESVNELIFAHPLIAEAAVRFANGDDGAAQHALRSVLAQEPGLPAGRAAGLALLDLYHAQGDLAAFEEFAAEFADQYAVEVPRWISTVAQVSSEGAKGSLSSTLANVWVCPLLLDESAVNDLRRWVESRSVQEPCWVDWNALVSADLPAARALLDLVEQWMRQPIELRFLGSAVLRRRLKASTPSGRRENDQAWWHLRLAMLRLMRHTEEFDLASLDFCVTYGALPPHWSEPLCQYHVVESIPGDEQGQLNRSAETGDVAPSHEALQPLATQLVGLDVLEWPAVTTMPVTEPALKAPTLAPGEGPRLSGQLVGDISPALLQLNAALDQHPPDRVFSIDCRQLARIDLVAAGSLLQWLLGAMARGVQLELTGVHRLLAAFFHVVGLDETVTVRLRQY